ncbi:MAG: NAD regulator [Rhizobiaceae bacterium]|nr:NAD regulator [Rhizobiaceae bacterium]
MSSHAVQIALSAVIICLQDNYPAILRNSGSDDVFADALPFGMFNPETHKTLEGGLRSWVTEKTGLSLGYCEQLQAFDDKSPNKADGSLHTVNLGYLALSASGTGKNTIPGNLAASWKSWYAFFPWEDWRARRPEIIDELIIPALNKWAAHEGAYATTEEISPAHTRIKQAFGFNNNDWNDELVVERYGLLYEAGLVVESIRDGNSSHKPGNAPLGAAMADNGRFILATAMASLRTRLKVRPVIFELMSDEFTLTGLQQSVESLCGRSLHKQNFRRQIDNANLVEPSGTTSQTTGGRPAALYRFRKQIINEYTARGIRTGGG